MNEIVIQSALFPPIQQFSWIMRAEKIRIEQHDTYAKQTFRNRFQILSPNGLQNLNIPVEKPLGSKTKMKDVLISYQTNWQEQIFRSIRTAYQNSAFYEYYIDDFAMVFNKKHSSLLELNLLVLKILLNIIEIDTELNLTKSYQPFYPIDKREIIHPKPQHRLEDKEYCTIEYYQLFKKKYGFIENLSILDLLFNEGPQTYFFLKKTIKNKNLSN